MHHCEWKLVIDGDKTLRFHIVEDPNEVTDVAAKEPELAAYLTATINKWRQLHPKDGVRAGDPTPEIYKAPPKWAEASR